jgi:predicted secreted protein
VRSFTPPGATLQLRAAIRDDTHDDTVTVDLSVSAEGKTVATARAEIVARGAA